MNIIAKTAIPNEMYEVDILADYLDFGEVKVLEKGATFLVNDDDDERVLVYVVSGKIRCSTLYEDGTEDYLFTSGHGGLVGALFAFKGSSHYMEATEKAAICLFNKEALMNLMAKDPEIMFEILKNYTAKVAYFMSTTNNLKSLGSYNRIVRLILNLYEEKGVPMEHGEYFIPLRISQKDISEITGVHFVTVSKTFKWLFDNQVAEKRNTGFYIYDLEKLKEIDSGAFTIKQ